MFVLLITVSFYRKQNENFQFVLALIFSVDEVNRNPDLLPNMTLLFEILPSGCKTLPQFRTCIQYYYSIRIKDTTGVFPNYLCKNWATCIVMLSGPSWVVSSMDATAMQSLYPYQVSFFVVMGWQEILSALVTLSGAKKRCEEETGVHLSQTV